jgi:hypothetical protein
MCTSGRVFVVGSYMPFRKRFGGRQLCSFQVGVCWQGVMYPSGSGLVVAVMYLYGRGMKLQLCAFLVG